MLEFFKRIFIYSLLITATSCVSNGNNFSFKTREWVNPELNDIHARVVVKKISPQVFSLKYSFEVPLDPVGGVNPTEFHWFNYCLAGKIAAQRGFTHWSLGTLDKNLKYKNTTAVELFVAISNENETLPSAPAQKEIEWLGSPQANEELYSFCTKLIRPEFMWVKSDSL